MSDVITLMLLRQFFSLLLFCYLQVGVFCLFYFLSFRLGAFFWFLANLSCTYLKTGADWQLWAHREVLWALGFFAGWAGSAIWLGNLVFPRSFLPGPPCFPGEALPVVCLVGSGLTASVLRAEWRETLGSWSAACSHAWNLLDIIRVPCRAFYWCPWSRGVWGDSSFLNGLSKNPLDLNCHLPQLPEIPDVTNPWVFWALLFLIHFPQLSICFPAPEILFLLFSLPFSPSCGLKPSNI